MSPLVELSNDINKGLKQVADSDALVWRSSCYIPIFSFHKTQEVAGAAADTVREKWNDMRNSSLFKSFESKLGTAYQSVSNFLYFYHFHFRLELLHLHLLIISPELLVVLARLLLQRTKRSPSSNYKLFTYNEIDFPAHLQMFHSLLVCYISVINS